MYDLPFPIPANKPVLIAGPTASGKSGLAMQIAKEQSRAIVNADALQVYDGWRILTARPSEEDHAQVDHHLYGHIPYTQDHSVGLWLRELGALLPSFSNPPVIVGGTGLYFRALTEGLAEIPVPGPEIRNAANKMIADFGLASMIADLDPKTLSRIDQQNPMRVQRAWEVLRATGKGLADWQDSTPPPLLPLNECCPILMSAPKDWLNTRIDHRFDQMVELGALEEAHSMLNDWDPARLSSKAIGAPELIAYLQGEISLDAAIMQAKIATHQYAKRQRTWFRARMNNWNRLELGQ